MAVVVFGSLLAAAPASASFDPLGFRLTSPVWVVHERDGAAVITVVRLNTAVKAWIRYGTWPLTGSPGLDYTHVQGTLEFLPGQSSATFSIPIVDHGIPDLPRSVRVGLYGAYPIGMAEPHDSVLTILNDDAPTGAIAVRDPANPLLLPKLPGSNLIAGARFYVDRRFGGAAVAARELGHSHPGWARALEVIAREPGARRFGAWDHDKVGIRVSQYLEQAARAQPGTIPMIATHRLAGGCRHHRSDSPGEAAAASEWYKSFARAIGYRPAVVLMEMDAIITVGCLSPHGVDVRMHEIRDAIGILSALPHVVVYLDAGAADALSAEHSARLLREAGISQIQGFWLNSTHFDWTSREIRYGDAISRMTGGKHFVINTGTNGRGPLIPPDRVHQGNEVLCNPPRRGLGPKPTTHTGRRLVDAFAWTSNPGESGAACRPGAPQTGEYWPQYALDLVRNADFRVR
jgi:endoglucanase